MCVLVLMMDADVCSCTYDGCGCVFLLMDADVCSC